MYLRLVLTTCTDWGVGCSFILQVLGGQIMGTLPGKTGQINREKS